MSELAFFLAVRLAAALGSGLLHAYGCEHHYGCNIGYHLEELIGYVVAAHLKAYLQCVAEAEEEAGYQHIACVPAAEYYRRQSYEATARDIAVNIGGGVAGG